MDNMLPGLNPDYVRIELNRLEDGWAVALREAEDARYIGPDTAVRRWEQLSWEEALTVVAATLDSYEPF